MIGNKQQKRAKEFVEYWKDKGYEKGESQKFWLQLLNEVFGIEKPTEFIEFEDQVHIDKSTGFIDGYIPSTKILIEQKSIDKDLKKGIRQADGNLLTPFQQAKKYITELPLSKHPKYVITCNFKSFLIYNMENPNGEPEEILLKDLEKEYYRLQFIVDSKSENLKKEMEVSIQAGELVGKLYEEILPLYKDPNNEESLKSLNMLCVRLVFCLYAEDAGIFGKRNMFHDYLARFEAIYIREALIKLFKILDTKIEERDPYLTEELAEFPYVNGGLFAEENIEIPMLNEKVKEILLTKASENFDWSDISPTIFGAVFESTLNPETRRSGGMHYTSIENIHKVIDPLFLDELKEELEEIKEITVIKTKKKKLSEFQQKIANLKFLDPACGSGNFLTETYISLRKLENEVIETLNKGQIGIGEENISPIQVSIGQFYGIEINDFAVTVAKTALWIAESQMMKETEKLLHINLDFLPLKTYANIVEANALRIDWEEVVKKEELNYIMGNPPFVGAAWQTEKQKRDIKDLNIFESKDIDYVSGWFAKSAKYIKNTYIKCAFVATNSISQGGQVLSIWKVLKEKYNIHINFAHKTFIWDSEASLKARVHCVVIGFSSIDNIQDKVIFENNTKKIVKQINFYLNEGPIIFIEPSSKPISNVPEMFRGNDPVDGGYLILTKEEMEELIKKEPLVQKFIRPYMMGKDFIDRKPRYCIWLQNVDIAEVRKCKNIMDRIEKVKNFRLQSKSSSTIKLADTPMLFMRRKEYNNGYVAIPKVSSQKRKYIPIDYLAGKIIPGDKLFVIENSTIYIFGIINSNVHMAWTRAICGRLKSDYSYSNTIVYNTFPFPAITKVQKEKIEKTAKGILAARALYPNNSLADLYDELTMPPELRKAHQENDKAVMESYGFDWKNMTESDCVAELMKMYQEKIKELSNNA